MSEKPLTTYLTASEVAERLRISTTTVYGLCYAGELEYCRFGTGKSNKRVRIIAASVAAYEARSREMPVESHESPRADRRRATAGAKTEFAMLRRFGWTPPSGMNVVN